MLDEQPLRLRRARSVARPLHANQCEGAVESVAVERDLEVAALQPFTNRVFFLGRRCRDVRRVRSAIPKHDGSATVLALGDRPLESVVIDRVILDLHRESLHFWIEARTLWHCPALHHSIELEPQVEVKIPCCVFLDHEAQAACASARTRLLSGWLLRAREIALLLVLC